ncbi:MAG: class I SAM-dependent methyltransferase [Candidatus Acidiferrales bacterium]
MNQLREEFNRWAESGKGESMEHEHWPITKPAIGLMQIDPTDNILDVGCGAGWLSRILAQRVPQGRVVGMDISDEMIRHAREASVASENLVFVVGGVDEIPWEANFFSRVISVESSYYWPDPAKGLREINRVLAEGGSVWILINYYRDNPYSHQWGEKLAVPTHLLSAAEWEQLFRDAGFADVAHRLIPDPTPNPDVYNGRWFRDAKELANFRAIGALLVYGTKKEKSPQMDTD